MLKYLNKGISTPIAIGIILVLVVLVGGFTWWQYSEIWKEETELPEIEIPEKEGVKDETADWETYRNEEYGFSVDIPYKLDIKSLVIGNYCRLAETLSITSDNRGYFKIFFKDWTYEPTEGIYLGENEDFVFTYYTPEVEDEIENETISSFKTFEPLKEKTTGFGIYRNEDIGIEFKYPKDKMQFLEEKEFEKGKYIVFGNRDRKKCYYMRVGAFLSDYIEDWPYSGFSGSDDIENLCSSKWSECPLCEVIRGPGDIPVIFQTCIFSGEGSTYDIPRFIFNNQSSNSDYRGIEIKPRPADEEAFEIYKEVLETFKFLD